MKILVVEDDPGVRDSIVAALRAELPQYEYVTANNLKDARALIDAAQLGEIFAAVLDQQFPYEPFLPEHCDCRGCPDGKKILMSNDNGSQVSLYLWQKHSGEIPILLHSSLYRDLAKPEYYKYDRDPADPRKWILVGKDGEDSVQTITGIVQHLAMAASHLPSGHQSRTAQNISQQGPGHAGPGEIVR